MKDAYEVILVGGGVIGAAVFNQLSQQYHGKVLLIEKSRFAQGSTGWSGGIVRCYHEDSSLTDMAYEGYAYYRQFGERTGVPCTFTTTGFLHFVTADRERYAKTETGRLSNKLDIQWLPKAEASRMFPHICWEDLAGAVYEPDAGHMDPVAVTKAWIAAGHNRGGEACEGVEFCGLTGDEKRIIGVQTNCGVYRTHRLIMCTGAWTGKLAHSASLDLPEKVYAKAIQLNAYETADSITSHPAYIDPVYELYGRADDARRIYLGRPVPEWHIDPDVPVTPDRAHIEMSLDFGRRRFEWAKSCRAIGGYRRFDAYTENGLGVICESESLPGLFWATGFSGGGFKLAPSVASQLQALINKSIHHNV